jgi:predicted AAA+ superfamily ATPase
LKRYLYSSIKELALARHKMALISGPRQVGKTTLSRSFDSDYDQSIYKNWDESTFRRIWTKSPNAIADEFGLPKFNESKLLILDEIHKSKGWKQKLKGLFDLFQNDLNIIVTGSARLNTYRKGGDSMMGRYLNFRLHPLSYGELIERKKLAPEEWRERIFRKPSGQLPTDVLDNLIKFSGFPEPYFAASSKILNIWRRGRVEKIIREDLRDLTRLVELSQVEMLASLLPTKVGSPLSVQSLREDLEVAHDTVSRWLRYLNELFYFFEVKPWTKSVVRSLKKEGKIYLYDWTEIEADGPKFENLIACHLLKACHFWTDTGEGNFDLFYLRNKEKQEIDFLITKDRKPWLAVEAKVSEVKIDLKAVKKLTQNLNCPFVQVVRQPGIWRVDADPGDRMVTSADHLLSQLC